jgi:outer membrane protein assembly factor BamE (lipoprotein component of BamABCDE complex)
MMIKPCLKVTIPLIALAGLLSGCASVGRDFKYQNTTALELQKTRNSEYQTMFGKPSSIEVKDTGDGKFELVRYLYAFADLGSARSRLLDLEFRDGLLNSYQYLSSFDKDKTTTNAELLKEIKRGESKKEDAIRILGQPHGRALCPTQRVDFKDKCGQGAEVWVWTGMGKVSTFGAAYGGAQPEMQTIFVTFNKEGVVTNAEASQTKTP